MSEQPWRCPDCGEWGGPVPSIAAKHCKRKPKVVHECPDCLTQYTSEAAAKACCRD